MTSKRIFSTNELPQNEMTTSTFLTSLLKSQLEKGRTVMWEKTDKGIQLQISHNEHSSDITVPKEVVEMGNGDILSGAIDATLAETLKFPTAMDDETMERNKLQLNAILDWESGITLSVCFNDTDEKPCHLTQQQRNYIDDALCFHLYENHLHEHFTSKLGATFTDLVKTLCFDWLKHEGRTAFRNMGWGGNWSNGQYSGLWADICFELAVNADFKGYCPHGRVFLGVRLEYKGTTPHHNPLHRIAGKQIANFVITQVEQMYEPHKRGKTTKLFPNFGKPYRWSVEVAYEKHIQKERARLDEEDKQKKKEEKRVAHEAFLAEQREREREWRARLEADLASTIVAYNAEETNLKKLIQFNREKVAAPLAKRIEAKEAERQREEAERRHAEKLAQKEAERLAKFAPKRK
jgi:hypothetical protein